MNYFPLLFFFWLNSKDPLPRRKAHISYPNLLQRGREIGVVTLKGAKEVRAKFGETMCHMICLSTHPTKATGMKMRNTARNINYKSINLPGSITSRYCSSFSFPLLAYSLYSFFFLFPFSILPNRV